MGGGDPKEQEERLERGLLSGAFQPWRAWPAGGVFASPAITPEREEDQRCQREREREREM